MTGLDDGVEREGCCDTLIVGGGLVGLAAAAFLAQQGLDVILVERHPSTSLHPKARLVNVRSMELYRSLGIEDEIRTAGEPSGEFTVADSLADSHVEWIPPAENAAAEARLSHVGAYSCDQQMIEPILRDRATGLGALLHFGTTATDIRQDDSGVAATLYRDGRPSSIRARFLVAADGAVSPIRKQLGIAMLGEGVPGTAVSALFRADLSPALRGRHVDALMARNAEVFLFARGNERERLWQLGTHLRPEWGIDAGPQELEAHLLPVIRETTGLPDLTPEIDSVLLWTAGAYVAQRLSQGRIFLVGDAAHLMPPYGGFGGNTGVQDAHNLAWKIAAVCRGEAGGELLETYAAERRPLVRLIVDQALLRSRKSPGQSAPPDQIDADTLTLGFAYRGLSAESNEADRSATTGDRSASTAVEDPAAPSGRPGTRLPHIGLCGSQQSTLELLDPLRFTFIADRDSRTAAALDDRPGTGIAVRTVDPRTIDPQHRWVWDRIYSGSDCDGILVRPDHVIAWRAPKDLADPVSAVSSALATASGRGPQWHQTHDQPSDRVT